MKVCRITKDIYSLYEEFIPKKYENALNNASYNIWGIYDGDGVKGAAVVRLVDGVAEISSLLYREDIKPPVCEKLISDTIASKAKEYGIDRISYVAQGDEDYLEKLDFAMMDIGFFPREGDVKKYCTTLEKIIKTQERYINIVEKRHNDLAIVTGEELTKKQINAYNLGHSNIPYREDELDPRISLFLIEDDLPVASLFARESLAGELVFVWMSYKSHVSKTTLLLMLHVQMAYAKKYYPLDKKVVVCPFTEEVEILISAFGFEEDVDENTKIHIYSLYL